MDKIVVFKYEDVRRLADCINSIQVSGFENAKLISMAANIIDTGRIKIRIAWKETAMRLDSIFYTIVGWLNFPDKSTPLGKRNLRHMDSGILQCAQHILSLSQDKAELSEVNTMVQDVTLM